MTVIASIATVPERAAILSSMVKSLEDRAEVVVYQNEAWGVLPGDYGKFTPLLEGKDCDYLLLCDDDLIYPENYVEVMTTAAYEFDAVVTCHGKAFLGNNASYYNGDYLNYRCLGAVLIDAYVDVPGTGVACIPRRLMGPLRLAMPKARCPNAADLHLAVALSRIGEQAIVIPHAAGWIKYNLPKYDRNIYDEVVGGNLDQSVQNAMLQEVLGCAAPTL